MNTGIIRRIDDLGRLTIPRDIRKALLISEGDPLELLLMQGGVFIQKPVNSCTLCGETQIDLIRYRSVRICHMCANNIKAEVEKEKSPAGQQD